MEFQEADDLLDRLMRSRANDNVSADDAVERVTGSRYTEAASCGTGSGASEWYADGGGWERKLKADPLPHGWEAHQSRSTGQTYYRNVYTNESQYDFPTQPAAAGSVYEREQADDDCRGGAGHERELGDDHRGGGRSGRDGDHGGGRADRGGGVRGPPRADAHAGDAWGAEPAHDPKGSFLDFDAKGSNLQSSRELFMQQLRASQGAQKGGKRSRSRKRKRKRSSSSSGSSSSSSSSRGKKRKKKKKETNEAKETKAAAPEDDAERINRIKKAREMRKRNAASDRANKADDCGTIDD